MLFIYNIGIRLYFLAAWFAAFFNKKAKFWVNGIRSRPIISTERSVWFHFASLGEFEQGRPVLEAIKLKTPATKIVITFFSPSGYEVRKDTELADEVYYLPLDTATNAANFINAIKPTKAIFTKYEYWYHYFNELHQQHIPLYIISGIFRPDQVFFKWYGSLHRKMLKMVTCFFVQDERSVELLKTVTITNTTVSGDTRFDRVWANAANPEPIPGIEGFKAGKPLFIAGSTWPEDEKLLVELVIQYPEWKFIIAPHEINAQRINELQRLLLPSIKYPQLTDNTQLTTDNRTLIIDNIGMLSSLYRYGDIAYIGGGFGKGIHNTLEAAAFGLPVIFGPNYAAFNEAKDLIDLKAGLSINNIEALKAVAQPLMNDADHRQFTGQKAKDYVAKHIGATEKIVKAITKLA